MGLDSQLPAFDADGVARRQSTQDSESRHPGVIDLEISS